MRLPEVVDFVMSYKGLKAPAMAARCGLSKDHINQIRSAVRGEKSRLELPTIRELAKGLDIDVGLLVNHDVIAGEEELARLLKRQSVLPWRVPRFTAGTALTDEEDLLNPIPLLRSPATDIATSPDGEYEIVGYFHTESAGGNADRNLFALQMEDDAMKHAYPQGSVVVIDRSIADPHTLEDENCACRVNGRLVIRVLHRTPRGYYLEAISSAYQRQHGTIEVTEEELDLVGKVVMWFVFPDG